MVRLFLVCWLTVLLRLGRNDMGWQRRNLKLKFAEGTEYDGLEIVMKRLAIGDLLSVSKLAQVTKTEEGATAAFAELLEIVAKSLVSWNIEDDDGNPVPIELGKVGHTDEFGVSHASTGLYNLDVELINTVVASWLSAAAGVSPPLPKNSNSGEQSLEEFDLTAALSESPQN